MVSGPMASVARCCHAVLGGDVPGGVDCFSSFHSGHSPVQGKTVLAHGGGDVGNRAWFLERLLSLVFLTVTLFWKGALRRVRARGSIRVNWWLKSHYLQWPPQRGGYHSARRWLVRRTTPGIHRTNKSTPTGLHHRGDVIQPFQGCRLSLTLTQGSSCLTTLG
jgi:hypothetical protein